TLAQAYQAADDDARALQTLAGAEPAGPMRAPWIFTRGFSLFRLGRYNEAEAVFRGLLSDPEMRAPAHFFLANCAYGRGEFAESVPLYDKAIAAGDTPSNRALNAYFYNRGLALYELRRFEPAAGSFRESINRYPQDAMPYLLLARCQSELGQQKEAMQSL